MASVRASADPVEPDGRSNTNGRENGPSVPVADFRENFDFTKENPRESAAPPVSVWGRWYKFLAYRFLFRKTGAHACEECSTDSGASTSGVAGSVSRNTRGAKARQKAWLVRAIMAALVIAYIWYTIFSNIRHAENDYIANLQEIVDQRTAYLHRVEKLDVVIVGGSNSLFGVSAEQISSQTGLRAYNISLMHEGHNDRSYFEFIGASIPRAVRSGVKFVVLSTIAPFGDLAAERRRQDENLTHDLVGRQRHFTLTPNEPLLYAIAVLVPQILSPPSRTSGAQEKIAINDAYGDLNFELITCRFTSEQQILNRASDVFEVILPRLQGIRTLFPHATIIVSIPPVAADLGGITERFVTELSTLLPENMLVSVTPTLDRTYFCDSELHPNARGRLIRTNSLISDILRAR